MKKNKKEYTEKILAGILFATMFLPLIALSNCKSHHNCYYDECMRVFNNDKFGVCVEKGIDDICFTIAILWNIIMIGSSMVFQIDKNAISPFVVMALFIAMSIGLSLIDPAKWMFVFSLLPSFVLYIIGVAIDSKNQKEKAKK